MYIIAGLGNPGGKYEKTKHNMGFQVIDLLADKYHIEMNQKKHKAICGTGIIEGVKVLLLKPQTFMNLSGESIRDAVDFYKIDPETELIVIYDDISLPPGHLRIRKKGSAGGHNADPCGCGRKAGRMGSGRLCTERIFEGRRSAGERILGAGRGGSCSYADRWTGESNERF